MSVKIFIAHRGEDSTKAISLRQTLCQSLGLQDDDIFVSSDSTSIQAGSGWFEDIRRSIDNSIVVIALLTEGWKNRPWIPFEAAYGLGRDKLMLPIVYEESLKNDPSSPFFHLQIKNLSSTTESHSFIEAVRFALEGGTSQPKIIPFISGNRANLVLQFYLTNPSRIRYNVRTVEVSIPVELIHDGYLSSFNPSMITMRNIESGGVAYRHLRFSADVQTVDPYYGTRPLTIALNPGDDRIEIAALQHVLKPDLVRLIGGRSKISMDLIRLKALLP